MQSASRNRRGALACSARASSCRRSSYSIPPRNRPRYSDMGDEHGLTPKQIDAFREVFNLFDINGGGTIDANELDSALKSVDIRLTRQEIVDVLQVMDEDGNGEIDFAEFLTLMTSTEKYLATLRGDDPSGEKEGSVFFTALTKFMQKSALSSLSEIDRYYNNKVRKAPHVVGHYAAGARLIGLTEREMAKRFATLSVSNKEADSPYAQPVVGIFVNKELKPRFGCHMTGKIKLKVNKSLKEAAASNEGMGKGGSREGLQSPSGLLPKIRSSSVTSAPAVAGYITTASSPNKGKEGMPRAKSAPRPHVPTFMMAAVPLPAVKSKSLTKEPSSLTIEDLPAIRSKVNAAYSHYKKSLSTMKEDVKCRHLEQMDVSSIPSKMLKSHFIRIAEAYGFSPSDFSTRPNLHPWNSLSEGKSPTIVATPGVGVYIP